MTSLIAASMGVSKGFEAGCSDLGFSVESTSLSAVIGTAGSFSGDVIAESTMTQSSFVSSASAIDVVAWPLGLESKPSAAGVLTPSAAFFASSKL